jgi:hypothetical protein
MFACSTHALLVDLPLFAGPVVLLAGALTVVTRRERRRARATRPEIAGSR